MPKAFENNHPLITAAVEPLRLKAVEDAAMRAATFARSYLDQLKKDGMDANVSFPYPSSMRLSRAEFAVKKADYNIVRSLTTHIDLPFTQENRNKDIRKVEKARVAKFIEEARERANIQFLLYVAKLTKKIGDLKTCELVDTGARFPSVWGWSFLRITKEDGSEQIWKTQQIWNRSKLNLDFPQWPSRQVKEIN
jgi:hypothetical protein